MLYTTSLIIETLRSNNLPKTGIKIDVRVHLNHKNPLIAFK